MWTSPNNTGDRSKTELDGRGIFHWALFWTDFFAFGRCIFDPAILNAFDGTVQYVSFSGRAFRNVLYCTIKAHVRVSVRFGAVRNFHRMLFDSARRNAPRNPG